MSSVVEEQQSPSGTHAAQSAPAQKSSRGNDGFVNALHYLLACIGFAIGLGNIWRFPSTTYENGGGAFLIAYVICALTFGIPLLFSEMVIGQYTQKGPSIAYKYYTPMLQGLGWAVVVGSVCVASYYNVIVAWCVVYMAEIAFGGTPRMVSCGNQWNTLHCDSALENEVCRVQHNASWISVQAHCFPRVATNRTMSLISASDEYFQFHILERTNSLEEFGGMNYKILGALVGCWLLIFITLIKGVKLMGQISLFTATAPFVLIAILFVRSVTLEGAGEGLKYYMTEPDWSYLFKLETWREALSQMCFSISVGTGGIMAMSSYNNFHQNIYRDVLIIIAADTFMAIFGGVTVFCTLGFIAKELQLPVKDVVQSSLGLAFIVYPEAINRMPGAAIWAFFFFFFLFLLGLTSIPGMLLGLIRCICEEFNISNKRQIIVTAVVCFACCLSGIIFATKAGIYWFYIVNDFMGGLALTMCIVVQVIITHFFYGPTRFFEDVREMMGEPKTICGRWFGASGYIIQAFFAFCVPAFSVIIVVANMFHTPIVYGSKDRLYEFPGWTETFGWSIGLAPLVCIPVYVVVNIVEAKRNDQPLMSILHVHPLHPSYDRINADYTDFEPPLTRPHASEVSPLISTTSATPHDESNPATSN